jgi:hypothetical protein
VPVVGLEHVPRAQCASLGIPVDAFVDDLVDVHAQSHVLQHSLQWLLINAIASEMTGPGGGVFYDSHGEMYGAALYIKQLHR